MSNFKSFWDKYEQVDLVAVPVNTVGVMGAGLAKAIWAKMTREDILEYFKLCQSSLPGDSKLGSSKFIFCFTKKHWKDNSQITWIENCLKNLIPISNSEKTLLLPRLGAGLGGLNPSIVDALIAKYKPLMKWKEVFLT